MPKLSEFTIAKLTTRSTDYLIADAGQTGLYVKVAKSGTKTFVYRYKYEGRERRYTIGKWVKGGTGGWSLTAARAEALQLQHSLIRENIDPLSERATRKAEPTLGTLLDSYLTNHIHATSRNKKSIADDERNARKIRCKFENRKAANISAAELQLFHATIKKQRSTRGQTVGMPMVRTANKCIKLLRRSYAWANKQIEFQGYLAGANPARDVSLDPEPHRTRYFSDEERRRFLLALSQVGQGASTDLIEFAFLTGRRLGSIQSMRWQDVDLERRIWTIPASADKTGRTQPVPLSTPSVNVLKNRQAKMRKNAQYVFENPATGRPINPRRKFETVLQNAEITDFRFHDLRHDVASRLASEGVSLFVAGKVLGHETEASTMRYAHLFDETLREAVELAGSSDRAPNR